MKRMIMSVLLAATPFAACAQEAIPHYHAGGGVYTSPTNCDFLRDYKAICVVNLSEYDITGIKCEGMMFSGTSALPGGTLPAGGISIIQFNSGTCRKDIEITWANHEKRSFTGEDIKSMTVWQIKGPRDPKHGGGTNQAD